MVDRERFDEAAFARKTWQLLEPIHAVCYFAPEPMRALREAGYRGFWMGYFAGRAAPLGAVGPEIVHALFYNFGYDRVAKALPDAWAFNPPEAALAARASGSIAALNRYFTDLGHEARIDRAADLAERAARQAPIIGRPLFAAYRSLPWPEGSTARLWHAATLLREHRGDGHVAALLVSGVEGRDAHVLRAAANGTTQQVYEAARDFDPAEWDQRRRRLAKQGLLAGTDLTEAGQNLLRHIDSCTDRLAATSFDGLNESERIELIDSLAPLADAVVSSGELPLDSPMGLDLRLSRATTTAQSLLPRAVPGKVPRSLGLGSADGGTAPQ